MKRLLLLVVVGIAGFFGYQYFQGKLTIPNKLSSSSRVTLPTAPTAKTSELFNVLGTTTTNLIAKGTDLLNGATDGKAEPIINKAVGDLQDRVKDLPAEEYRRVKYEFCKDVFPSTSPESKD